MHEMCLLALDAVDKIISRAGEGRLCVYENQGKVFHKDKAVFRYVFLLVQCPHYRA